MTIPTAATQTGGLTRRAALGLALASALPVALGERTRVAAAEPVPGTWMYAGNPARTGVFPGPGLDLSQDIVELWRIDEGQTGMFTVPCGVCDGIAYYLPVPGGISPEVRPLIAVDAQTGSELWRHDPPQSETSFSGMAAIVDGLLVIPTGNGFVVGLDAKSGEERWVFDVQGRCRFSNAAIVDGVLYLSDDASVNAIQLGDTPEWLWKAPLGDGDQIVVSGTVSVEGEYLIVSSLSPIPDSELQEKSTVIHVLNLADGAEAYRNQFLEIGESQQFAAQNGMLYSRADRAYLERSHLFSLSIDGTEQWSLRTSTEVPAYPAVKGDVVYLAGGGGVWGHNAATGETLWSSPQLGTLNSEIVLIDDVIYIGAAPPAPMVYALSATDGTVLKSIEVPFNGAQVIGITDGVLIARSGVNMVALGTPS